MSWTKGKMSTLLTPGLLKIQGRVFDPSTS